jgi:hypothetical protein
MSTAAPFCGQQVRSRVWLTGKVLHAPNVGLGVFWGVQGSKGTSLSEPQGVVSDS